jgi:SanA protein
MKRYALKQGVPEADIVLDYAGRRTYDTCFRAHEIFGIQEAILVTQTYHLNRALYTCNGLGITSIGASADKHAYAGYSQWLVREWLARIVAWYDVLMKKPAAVLGDKIDIFK